MDTSVLSVKKPHAVEAVGMRVVEGSPTYARYAADYFAWVRATGHYVADPGSVRAWMRERMADHAPSSLIPMLAAVKRALRGAAHEMTSAREAAAFSEALRDIKPPKRAKAGIRRSFLLTSAEEKAVLARMTPRDAALFRFLLVSGARISEALHVKLEDCKPDGRMVRVLVLGKGCKQRELRVPVTVYDEVRGAFPGSVWLFESAGGKPLTRDYAFRRVSGSVLAATGKRYSPHCARHQFATRVIERTGKIAAVSEYLGHSSVSTTLSLYVHQHLDDAELEGLSGN